MTDTLEERLRRDLARVAATIRVTSPPVPGGGPPPRIRPSTRIKRRRAVLVGSVVAATAFVAVPAAAATNTVPALRAAFGWTQPSEQRHEAAATPVVGSATPARGAATSGLPVIQANDATGKLRGTIPGPTGSPVQVWTADAVGGGTCVSVLAPVPGGYNSLLSGCDRNPPAIGFGAGGGGDTGWGTLLYAQGATYVTLTDGHVSQKLPVHDGVTAAWVSASDAGVPLTLTAYTSSGQEIGSTTAPDVPVADPSPIPPCVADPTLPYCSSSVDP